MSAFVPSPADLAFAQSVLGPDVDIDRLTAFFLAECDRAREARQEEFSAALDDIQPDWLAVRTRHRRRLAQRPDDRREQPNDDAS